MKLRFSLRMLLVCTVAVAAVAAFVALRSRPIRVAKQFQSAIQRGDKDAVAAMIQGPGIEQTLKQKGSDKEPVSWKFISCEADEQSTSQWLRGVCAGRFVVEFHFIHEGDDSVLSAYQESQYDVSVTTNGVQIVDFTQQDPACLIIPIPPYESEVPDQPANE
jgi:hypothetical protein